MNKEKQLLTPERKGVHIITEDDMTIPLLNTNELYVNCIKQYYFHGNLLLHIRQSQATVELMIIYMTLSSSFVQTLMTQSYGFLASCKSIVSYMVICPPKLSIAFSTSEKNFSLVFSSIAIWSE